MTAPTKAGYRAYVAAPLMMMVLYALASGIFWLLFKDTATIVFFAILALVHLLSMSLYAVVPLKAKNTLRLGNIFLISALLFGLACILGRQNFQIEGFFFYFLTGTFGGVMVHFLVGKILGPLMVGRTWCGWGCWTLMLLELLPFKKSPGWRQGWIKQMKWWHLFVSLALVAGLVFLGGYYLHDPRQAQDQPGLPKALAWFVLGNGLYYATGVLLALAMRDNRAFCKYLCPVSLPLKFSSLFALLRIKGDKEKCLGCNTCVEQCPASIDIPGYLARGTRVKSTECLMCMRCVAVCPQGVLGASIGLDVVSEDYLRRA